MAELVWAIVSGALAIVSMIISIMSFNEKGYLFNNAYIWATKEERKSMNYGPLYRQSAIAFALIAAVFLFMALACVLENNWLWIAVGVLSIALLIYVIASSVKGTKL